MMFLAALYMFRGQYAKAEVLSDQALEGCRKSLGDAHALTLFALFVRGGICRNQGQYAKAESLLKQVLEEGPKAVGNLHPRILLTQLVLGNLYRFQSRLDEAEPLFIRALAGYSKALGDDHPNTLNTLSNLADLYRDQGRLDKEETLLRQLQANARGKENSFWFQHDDVPIRLGENLIRQRKYAEAEPLLRECFKSREQQVVDNALERLVQLYDAWDKPEQAAPLRAQQEQRLGGFVRDWLVLEEPILYHGDGALALDQEQVPGEAALRPRVDDRARAGIKDLAWKEHRSAMRFLNFGALYGQPTNQRVAYAVCYIVAETERTDLILKVGSDDQAKLYLNGREVYKMPKPRPLKIDEDEVKAVTLRKGTNVLVFKVVNEIFDWAGSLHFVDKDGHPAKGLQFRLTP
jgi:hypothetical protein